MRRICRNAPLVLGGSCQSGLKRTLRRRIELSSHRADAGFTGFSRGAIGGDGERKVSACPHYGFESMDTHFVAKARVNRKFTANEMIRI
ncbi:MAG: hypothetical protein EKK40_15390 [Bradyrhizobiaceae bacterium]|nr:MAG: hypothetical protein EKK40_15390 [Bradyrhizobiaceae bacterium]